MPSFQKIMEKANELIFKTAEGIGSAFDKGPQKLGQAFSDLKNIGTRKIGSTFKGISSGVQRGVYHTAEGIGKAFEDPRGTAQRAISGTRNIGRRFVQSNFVQSGLPHLRNAMTHGRTFARLAGRRIGGFLGGRVGRGATALGAGAAGLASAGMKSLGTASAAPFKVVSGAFAKLGSAGGGLLKTIGLFGKLAGPTALIGVAVALKTFVNEVVESNRSLAKWNGKLSASFAKLDIQKMRLDIQTANASSGTGSELNKAFGEMLHEFQPIREGLAVLTNVVATNLTKSTQGMIALVRAAAVAIPALKEIVDGLKVLEEEAKKKDNDVAFPGNAALGALAAMGGGGAPRPVIGPRQFLDDPAGNPRRGPDGAIRAGGRRVPFHFEGGGM